MRRGGWLLGLMGAACCVAGGASAPGGEAEAAAATVAIDLLPERPLGLYPPGAEVGFTARVVNAAGTLRVDFAGHPGPGFDTRASGDAHGVVIERDAGGAAWARIAYDGLGDGVIGLVPARPVRLAVAAGGRLRCAWRARVGGQAIVASDLLLRDAQGAIVALRLGLADQALAVGGWRAVEALAEAGGGDATRRRDYELLGLRFLPAGPGAGSIELDDLAIDGGVSGEARAALLDWEARDQDGALVATGGAPFALTAGGEQDVALRFTPSRPGIVRLAVRVRAADGPLAESPLLAQADGSVAVLARRLRLEGASAPTVPAAVPLAPPSSPPPVPPKSPAPVAPKPARAGAAGAAPSPVPAAPVVGASVPVAPPPPFLWGMCEHLAAHPWPAAEHEIALMSALGVGLCRTDAMWSAIQGGGPTAWRWRETDRVLTALRERGIRPLVVLGGPPRWACVDPAAAEPWSAVPRSDAYAAFVGAIARRHPTVGHWQIHERPDLPASWAGDLDQYLALFTAGYQAIKAADAGDLVLNGGFAWLDAHETQREASRLLITGFLRRARPRPDIVAVQVHADFAGTVRSSERFQLFVAGSGLSGRPVWQDEAGYSSGGGRGERDQAMVLFKKLVHAQASGHRACVLYQVRDQGGDPARLDHHYGIVRHDFAPKAALVAVHTAIDRLEGAVAVRGMDLGPDLHAYLFAGHGRQVLALWHERPGGGAVVRRLRTTAGAAALVDPMGLVAPLAIVDGAAEVPIAGEPVLVELSGGTDEPRFDPAR